jgi:RsiW-degrading membrane proteinase PrsW (M82 family)
MILGAIPIVLAKIVEVEELRNTVLAAVASGVGVTTLFSLAIYGITRFAESSRDERPLMAAATGILGFVCLAGVLAAVAFGLAIMTQK